MARTDYPDADVLRYYTDLQSQPGVVSVYNLPDADPTAYIRDKQQQRPRAILMDKPDDGLDLWPLNFWMVKNGDGREVGFWEPTPQPFSCKDPSVAVDIYNALGEMDHILYVGWSPRDGVDHLDQLSRFESVTVLDIWGPAIKDLPVADWGGRIVGMEGDIRDWSSLNAKHNLAVIWSHGPEHMEKDDAIKVLSKIHRGFDLVVVASPHGWVGNASGVAKEGNPYEEHRSGWTTEDYTALGYRMTRQGPKGHLIGFRR
jgi:hypothetical protein